MSDGFGLGAATPIQRGIQRLRPRSRVTPSGIDARTEVAPIQPPTEALTAAPTTRTPDIAQARVASEQRRSLFQENPLQAIGLVLSNIAAGFEGRTLPTEEFERQRLEQEKLRQSQALLGINALETFADLAPKLDEEGRASLARKLTEATGGAFDFENLNLRPNVEIEDARELFTGIAPDILGPLVRAAGGPEAFFNNTDMQELGRTQTDQKYLGTSLRKLQAGIQAVAEVLTPEQRETALGQTFDFSFIRDNAQSLGLEPFEVASLERNQGALISTFAQFGGQFVPEGTKTPAQIKAEAEAKRAGTLAAEQAAPTAIQPLNLQFPDGTIRGFDPKDTEGIESALAKGAVRINLGAQAGTPGELLPGFRATGEIEVRIIDATESLGRLETIEGQFRPEFLERLPKAGAAILAEVEKLGFELSPDEQQFVTDFATFARNAQEFLNLEIKRITGAQMSEAEAARLSRGIPDPQKDSPTQFAAKLASATAEIRASVFRLGQLRQLGFTGIITEQISRQFPLESFLPPSDESDAKLAAVDEDGNPIGGIRLPRLAVPLGTYQGFNPRRQGTGAENYLKAFDSSFWPLATTRLERLEKRDARLSIEERYSDKSIYVSQIEDAANSLRNDRFLLDDDAAAIVQFARQMVWPPYPIDRWPFWAIEK